MQRRHGTAPGVVLAVVLAVLLTGLLAGLTACGQVPGRPGTDQWRETARTSVDQAIAQVGTAAMVLEQEEADRLLGGYGVATIVHAEESMGSAADTILKLQAPPEVDVASLEEALGEAEAALRTARSRVVRGEHDPALVERLERIRRQLEEIGGSL